MSEVNQPSKFTTIESIGRDGLIKKIAEKFERHDNDLIFGIGDDAAVIQPDAGTMLLISSETYHEGVDFDLTYMPFHHLGFKLVSMAMSDICAMNGHPKHILVNLSLTNKISVEMTELFYTGIDAACKTYGAKLAGGDISASGNAMSITVTVAGSAKHPVYRSGAKPDDAICVTGDLGAAACGLMILIREKRHWMDSGEKAMQPELEEFEYVVRRQLVPQARTDLIKAFEEADVQPHAAIDLSQGLNRNLIDMMQASGCGALIYEAALPVHPDTRHAANDLNEDIDKFVLFGGEETEILFTMPQQMVEKFSKEFKDFTVIGKVLPSKEGIAMQTAEGHRMTLT